MAYELAKHVFPFLLQKWTGTCTGIEHIPKSTGAVLAANHASYLDHFIIGGFVFKVRTAHYLAKKEHFDSFFQGLWHRYLPAIPLDRESGGQEGLQKAIEHLRKGNLIMIYPEGTRTLTGKMSRAKTGAARLALSAHVPVIPMGITHTFHILPKGKKIPVRGKADLHIGKPLYFDHYYGKENDHATLRKVTTIIMKEIARLSNQRYDFDEAYA